MPFILGNESAGTVVAVGEGVDSATYGFTIGDRVAVRPPPLAPGERRS